MDEHDGTMIAESGTVPGARDKAATPMRQASVVIPSPLRRGAEDPIFTAPQMPRTFFGFVWRLTAWDQVWLTLLSIGVSVLGTVPIEIQRRIVNEAIKQKNLSAIGTLALIYTGLVVAQGSLKLVLNMYRSWVNANSVRLLRNTIRTAGLGERPAAKADAATSQGVEISMIVAEADAVGGYIGDCISEPVLETSILVTVIGYMVVLQPLMAAVSLLTFLPQLVFVPILQLAINRRVRARVAMLREAGADVIADQEEADSVQLSREGRFREVFRLDMGIYTLKFTLNFLMNVSTHLGTVAILALGAWLVVEGRTEVGTVVAFLSGLANMTDPWGELINWFQALMVTSTKYGLVRDAAAKMSAGEAPGADQRAAE